jgi:ATP-dependent helicase/DNAse subunit B
MSLNIANAPAGAGKSQFVIAQIRVQCQRKALPRVLVILASAAQLVTFRERLAADATSTFGATLTDFHTLYRDVLDSVGALPRLMPEAARYRVVRAVIRQLTAANQLPYFAPIAEKPGFIAAVSDLIAEHSSCSRNCDRSCAHPAMNGDQRGTRG